jgi:hypothetical protein
MDFVAVGRIVLAQPSMFVGGPSIEIMGRFTREHLLPEIGPQGKKMVLQPRCELRLRQGAHVRPDKSIMQEADNQGRMIGNQQPPSRMPASKRFERAIIHCGYPDAAADRVMLPFDTGPKSFCSVPHPAASSANDSPFACEPSLLFFVCSNVKRRIFGFRTRGEFHSGYLGSFARLASRHVPENRLHGSVLPW